MKKTLLIILTTLFISQVFSQAGNNELAKRVESIEISNKKLQRTNDSLIELLRNQFVTDSIQQKILESKMNALNTSLSNTNQRIDEERLQKSLDVADSTLSKQNFLIDGYSYILAAFTFIIAIMAIIFGFLSRRIINDATNATERLNDRMDYFDKKVNTKLKEKFDDYELRVEKRAIDELFKDLNCQTPVQRKSAFERLFGIESKRIKGYVNQLFSILNSQNISREEKSIIVEVLIQIDNDERH